MENFRVNLRIILQGHAGDDIPELEQLSQIICCLPNKSPANTLKFAKLIDRVLKTQIYATITPFDGDSAEIIIRFP